MRDGGIVRCKIFAFYNPSPAIAGAPFTQGSLSFFYSLYTLPLMRQPVSFIL